LSVLALGCCLLRDKVGLDLLRQYLNGLSDPLAERIGRRRYRSFERNRESHRIRSRGGKDEISGIIDGYLVTLWEQSHPSTSGLNFEMSGIFLRYTW